MLFTGTLELERQLEEAGNKLLQLPHSVVEILSLLDQVENYLSRVEQSPSKSMQTALSPSRKALVADELLRHRDADVKVAVASCISQITRITAPYAPYDDQIDEDSQEIFQLIVWSFENLSDKSGRSYNKRTLILETVATVRSCLVMLDLECDGLIVEMFHFLKAIMDYHSGNVFSSMETIMTLVLEESGDISLELISPILASLKSENQVEVLPLEKSKGADAKSDRKSRVDAKFLDNKPGDKTEDARDGTFEDLSKKAHCKSDADVSIADGKSKDDGGTAKTGLKPKSGNPEENGRDNNQGVEEEFDEGGEEWPSTFVRLGNVSAISRKFALDSLVSFMEVLENVSLPSATPKDFESVYDGLDTLVRYRLEVDWLRKRINQMVSRLGRPIVRNRLEKASKELEEVEVVAMRLKDKKKGLEGRVAELKSVGSGRFDMSSHVGQGLRW
ncbi:hypothetical protein RHSIM_Rhsim02G0215700 [Rhododendron simsii]|uniref:Uncharacterized protein n=1 Tax=Rhododendron simsii TaxID=118357 RepID=A0A834HCJ8_RHOSS|nr:hypothetical protein RHSIM_Rhsim02G0215700 [Rhododendron simsii]